MIELSDIRYTWPRQMEPALTLSDLSVKSGERLFVQGPSGSGKSTLLSLLAGIITPQRGTVRILEQRIDKMSGPQRDHFRARHIGYIFQQFNLVPYLSVIENVTLPLRFSKERLGKVAARAGRPRAEAQRLLEHIGLFDDLLHRPVTELSVGQQQRVAAARALIGAPELVVADEPTSALDADNREAFIKLLFAECKEAGSTLAFVSHDRNLAELFDRTIELSASPGSLPEGAP